MKTSHPEAIAGRTQSGCGEECFPSEETRSPLMENATDLNVGVIVISGKPRGGKSLYSLGEECFPAEETQSPLEGNATDCHREVIS